MGIEDLKEGMKVLKFNEKAGIQALEFALALSYVTQKREKPDYSDCYHPYILTKEDVQRYTLNPLHLKELKPYDDERI